MPTAENPHAGTGSVVLDIGGDIGALLVTMPPDMVDLEVEIIPTGTDQRPADRITSDPAPSPADHHHHADGTQHHDHAHDDHAHDDHVHDDHVHGDDEHGHDEHSHAAGLPPHVAVVARPAADGTIIHSLVYGELTEGSYDLYVRPNGPIRLTATVIGGQVTQTEWPQD